MPHQTAPPEEKVPPNFITSIVDDDLKTAKHTSIITRFPPEPNGYLHLGHAKSLCLNFGLARDYKGQCNLRFDDTNPEKEEMEFIEGIQNDIKWLGFDWGANLFYASDYFPKLYADACKLIGKGLAYVDTQTPEQVAANRGDINTPGVDSPDRNQTPEKALELFEGMKDGTYKNYVLRAKIDMAHANPLMRDPLMYRYKADDHPRTGGDWHIYPLYDYAHGQSDSYETITHSICTLEFEVHRVLYDWFQEHLEITKTRQIEFARLNLTNTVMSKRKLMRLVQDGIVSGWDDPRMPTICGMRRRGYPAAGIRDFCGRVGVAKRDNLQKLDLLELCVREKLMSAPRVMIVADPLKVTITNYEGEETFEAANVPGDDSKGTRQIPFSGEVFIDRSDFMEDPPADSWALSVGKEVRLRWAYWIKCTEVVKDAEGKIVELKCTYDPSTKGGAAPTDNRKVKGTIHWACAKKNVPVEMRIYDKLFLEETPEANPDWIKCVSPESLVVKQGIAEEAIKTIFTDESPSIQAERVGFFCKDQDATPEKLVLNRTVKLQESFKSEDAEAKKQAEKDSRAKIAAERAAMKADKEARKAAKKAGKKVDTPEAAAQ